MCVKQDGLTFYTAHNRERMNGKLTLRPFLKLSQSNAIIAYFRFVKL